MKMHSDAELAELLGASVVERTTIHEWPLSRVQRVRLGDGRRLIYKMQLPPSVEPEFYAQAASPLLPGHRALGTIGDGTAMTIDWVTAPTLATVTDDEAEQVEHVQRVIDAIGGLDQDLPVYVDVGTPEAWSAVVDTTLKRMRMLIEDGRFTSTDLPAVQRIDGVLRSIVGDVTAAPRIIQWDMKADQIFVRPDGYTVIDWQRPARAPAELDLMAFLVDAQIDPHRYVAQPFVTAYWFLRLQWAVDAQYEIFPAERWPIFDEWAIEAVSHMR